VLQLWEDRALCGTMPHQETEPGPEAIQGRWGNARGSINQRWGGKRGSPGVEIKGELLGQTTTTKPKPPEPTYIISSVGPYQRDEKIILKVIIRGSDNKGHVMMAMVDCGAMENFIDKEYAEWNGIPLKEKRVPRRVLAVDGREVASRPVTHDAMVE
jgi:hypothetical protein